MAASVGGLSVKLALQSQEFTKGLSTSVNQSKNWGREMKRVYEQVMTPMERYQRELTKLNMMKQVGLDHTAHARAVEQLQQKYSKAIPEFRRAATDLGKVQSESAKLGRMGGLAKSIGAAAAAAVAYKGIGAIRNMHDEITTLHNDARKLGTDTGQLAGLQVVGEREGLAKSTTTMALQRMTRRVAEASVGTGEAQGALKELGLDPKELLDAGPIRALEQIADAMGNVEDQGHRVRLAFKLFDSEGVAMVNILNQGGDSLRKEVDAARQLSGVTSAGASALKSLGDDTADAWTGLAAMPKTMLQGVGVLYANMKDVITGGDWIAESVAEEAKNREKAAQAAKALAQEQARIAADSERAAKAEERRQQYMAKQAAASSGIKDFLGQIGGTYAQLVSPVSPERNQLENLKEALSAAGLRGTAEAEMYIEQAYERVKMIEQEREAQKQAADEAQRASEAAREESRYREQIASLLDKHNRRGQTDQEWVMETGQEALRRIRAGESDIDLMAAYDRASSIAATSGASRQSVATGMQYGSSEAYSAYVASLAGGGEDEQTELQRKANSLLDLIALRLKQIQEQGEQEKLDTETGPP